MLRHSAGPCALLLAMLAGCDGGVADAPDTEPIKITASSEYVDRLRGLSDMNRDLALRRAIQDSGESCKRVESSAYQEDYKNLSMWTARCSDGKDWAVFIAPNADVQVRNCVDAATLGLPECRFDPVSS